jgi:hypothetical protein
VAYTIERGEGGASIVTGGKIVYWVVKRNDVPVYWTTGGPEMAQAYVAAREGAGKPIPWNPGVGDA